MYQELSYTENRNPHTYTFAGKCVVTGKDYSVTVDAKSLFRYQQGEYIQHCFADLSIEDREFLITGMSPEGWEITFGEEDV